jgi:uncharacterized SAM-binding protein YcdF (DUF218 family)
MIRRLFGALLVLGITVLLAGGVTFLYISWRINHTGSSDMAQPADAIVILGALVQANGEPGPDLRVRTLHGVTLFQRGLAPYVICTGGFEGDRSSAAAVCRKLAVSQGVPEQKVLLADGSMTTREDAASASSLLNENRWQSIILISHPLHLERARLLFEGKGIVVHPSPTNTNLAAIPWRTRAWLTAREAMGITWIILEEIGIPYEWTIPLSRLVYGAQVPLSTE